MITMIAKSALIHQYALFNFSVIRKSYMIRSHMSNLVSFVFIRYLFITGVNTTSMVTNLSAFISFMMNRRNDMNHRI